MCRCILQTSRVGSIAPNKATWNGIESKYFFIWYFHRRQKFRNSFHPVGSVWKVNNVDASQFNEKVTIGMHIFCPHVCTTGSQAYLCIHKCIFYNAHQRHNLQNIRERRLNFKSVRNTGPRQHAAPFGRHDNFRCGWIILV